MIPRDVRIVLIKINSIIMKKERFVYAIVDRHFYDDREKDNYECILRCYGTLKKALNHLKFWSELYESNMRSEGKLSDVRNYVRLDYSPNDKLYTVLYVREGAELHTVSIKEISLY